MSAKVIPFAPKFLGNWQAQQKELFTTSIALLLKGGNKDEQHSLLERLERTTPKKTV